MRLLGKNAKRHDDRTFQMVKYLKADKLPPVAPNFNNSHYVKDAWGMMLNDRYGDCVVAGAGHGQKVWHEAINPNKKYTVSDSRVKNTYFQLTGGVDSGLNMLDFLNHWRHSGIFGYKIDAFVEVELKNLDLAKLAMQLFGFGYLGIAMPKTAQNQGIWTVTKVTGDGAPGSWGGHCVIVVDYDSIGPTCVTWGELIKMTWGFYNTYVDESYAILSRDWIGSDGSSVSGFDYATLKTDLGQLKKAA